MRAHVLAAIDALRTPFTDARVHEVRRALKRARAELRLVRAAIGAAHFRAANRSLRDVGRGLAPWRDARVLVDSCDVIAGKVEEPGLRRVLHEARGEFARQHGELHGSARRAAGMTRSARQALTEMLERARQWPSGPLDAALLSAGAALIYRRGRRSLAAARRRPDGPALHEWRKQSRYLADGLTALGGGRGRRIDKLAARVALLATTLGEGRDLHLLCERLRAGGAQSRDPALTRAVIAAIGACRHKLERKSLAAAKAIFGDRPGSFEAKLGKALLKRH